MPSEADADAAPEWKTVSASGSVEFHDHRIHWMAQGTPPQVSDEGVRTKVFDWSVPIAIDGSPASVQGELFWEPDESGFPLPAIAALVVVGLTAVAFVVVVRMRRGRADGDGSDTKEAW